MVILSVVHLGAMLLLIVTPLSWPLRIGVLIWLAWSLYWTVTRYALCRAATSVEAIEIDREGEVAVRFAGDTAWHSCRRCASFVHPWLMLLSLRLDGRKWPVSVVVAADSVEPEAFRRWRVALRLHAAAG